MHRYAILESLYGLIYSVNTEDHLTSKVLLPNDEIARICKEVVVG